MGPALQSGEADCYFGSLSSSFRLENTRILAVGTPERYELAMDAPTLRELGIDLVSIKRRGIVGPQGMAPERVEYLQDLIRKINENPAYIEDMKRIGLLPDYQDAAAFARIISDETATSADILKSVGYKK